MATLHDRAIEDSIMQTLAGMWKGAGATQASIASMVGVSQVTIWQWVEGGMAFPNSLSRLRRLVEASGAKLHLKITRDDDEFIF
jgi:transcriptional regulator with XRE-family HTH domain